MPGHRSVRTPDRFSMDPTTVTARRRDVGRWWAVPHRLNLATCHLPCRCVTLIPYSLAVGDFNEDGNLDIATGNEYYEVIGHSVSVLLGRGDGTFVHVAPPTGSGWA